MLWLRYKGLDQIRLRTCSLRRIAFCHGSSWELFCYSVQRKLDPTRIVLRSAIWLLSPKPRKLSAITCFGHKHSQPTRAPEKEKEDFCGPGFILQELTTPATSGFSLQTQHPPEPLDPSDPSRLCRSIYAPAQKLVCGSRVRWKIYNKRFPPRDALFPYQISIRRQSLFETHRIPASSISQRRGDRQQSIRSF